MSRWKRIGLMLAGALLFAGNVFAQTPVEEPDPVNWLHYAALALGAVLVPLGADLLKRVWPDAPSLLKQLMPLVAGSLIAMAEAALLGVLGEPIDLSMIEQVLTGVTAGAGMSFAFHKGSAHEAGKRVR